MNFFHKGEESFSEPDIPKCEKPFDLSKYNYVYFFRDGGVHVETARSMNMTMGNEAYVVLKAVPEGPDITPHAQVLKSRGAWLCGPQYHEALSAHE